MLKKIEICPYQPIYIPSTTSVFISPLTSPNISKYESIISLHFSILSSLPTTESCFYFNKNTTMNEISSFIIKITNEPNNLWSFINFDSFPFDIQAHIIDTINTNPQSKVIIITNQKRLSSWIPSSYKLNSFNILTSNIIKSILKQNKRSFHIVHSDINGSGKTTLIKSLSKSKDYTYTRIVISDDTKWAEIISVIEGITNNTWFHIELNNTDFSYVEYLLFNIIILETVHLGLCCEFYVEIGRKEYIDQLNILRLFPYDIAVNGKETMKSMWLNINNKSNDEKVNEKIKYVSHYLYLNKTKEIYYNHDKDFQALTGKELNSLFASITSIRGWLIYWNTLYHNNKNLNPRYSSDFIFNTSVFVNSKGIKYDLDEDVDDDCSHYELLEKVRTLLGLSNCVGIDNLGNLHEDYYINTINYKFILLIVTRLFQGIPVILYRQERLLRFILDKIWYEYLIVSTDNNMNKSSNSIYYFDNINNDWIDVDEYIHNNQKLIINYHSDKYWDYCDTYYIPIETECSVNVLNQNIKQCILYTLKFFGERSFDSKFNKLFQHFTQEITPVKVNDEGNNNNYNNNYSTNINNHDIYCKKESLFNDQEVNSLNVSDLHERCFLRCLDVWYVKRLNCVNKIKEYINHISLILGYENIDSIVSTAATFDIEKDLSYMRRVCDSNGLNWKITGIWKKFYTRTSVEDCKEMREFVEFNTDAYYLAEWIVGQIRLLNLKNSVENNVIDMILKYKDNKNCNMIIRYLIECISYLKDNDNVREETVEILKVIESVNEWGLEPWDESRKRNYLILLNDSRDYHDVITYCTRKYKRKFWNLSTMETYNQGHAEVIAHKLNQGFCVTLLNPDAQAIQALCKINNWTAKGTLIIIFESNTFIFSGCLITFPSFYLLSPGNDSPRTSELYNITPHLVNIYSSISFTCHNAEDKYLINNHISKSIFTFLDSQNWSKWVLSYTHDTDSLKQWIKKMELTNLLSSSNITTNLNNLINETIKVPTENGIVLCFGWTIFNSYAQISTLLSTIGDYINEYIINTTVNNVYQATKDKETIIKLIDLSGINADYYNDIINYFLQSTLMKSCKYYSVLYNICKAEVVDSSIHSLIWFLYTKVDLIKDVFTIIEKYEFESVKDMWSSAQFTSVNTLILYLRRDHDIQYKASKVNPEEIWSNEDLFIKEEMAWYESINKHEITFNEWIKCKQDNNVINGIIQVFEREKVTWGSLYSCVVSNFYMKIWYRNSFKCLNYLWNNYNSLNQAFDLLCSSESSVHVKVASIACIKVYLKMYSDYWWQASNRQDNIIDNVNKILLKDTVFIPEVRNYLWKHLIKHNVNTIEKWIDYLPWWKISDIKSTSRHNLLIKPVMPIYEQSLLKYGMIVKTPENWKEYFDSKEGENMNQGNKKFIIWHHIIITVYLNHTGSFLDKSTTYSNALNNWFEHPTLTFIDNLISNFPADPLFHITWEHNPNQVGLLIWATIIYSYIKSNPSTLDPYLSSLNNWNSLTDTYLPGGYVDYHDENINILIKDYKDNPELYGVTIGLYECRCGFLYTIGNCTRPYVVSKCPYCNSDIGGTGHKLIEGHKCIINAENKDMLNKDEKVIGYLNSKFKYRKGYFPKNSDEMNELYTMRKMCQFTFRFFNYWTHSFLYLQIINGDIPENQAQNIMFNNISKTESTSNVKEYLIKHVNNDIEKLGKILDDSNYFIFVLLIFNDYIAYINKGDFFSDNLVNHNQRAIFEENFQTKIILPKINYVHNSIKEYYWQYHTNKQYNKDNLMYWLTEQYGESDNAIMKQWSYYDYIRHFQYTRTVSVESFTTEFWIHDKDNKYALIRWILTKLEILREIQLYLYDIIYYTNTLLDEYKNKYTRNETKGVWWDECKEDAEGKDKFKWNWSKINYKITKYKCKKLPKLDKISYWAFCWCDEHELGYGLYMASMFEYFATIQNEIIDYLKAHTNITIDNKKYPIQRISKKHLIWDGINVDSLMIDWINFCNLYNWNYGEGGTKAYQYDKIEEWIYKELYIRKDDIKLLSCDNWNTIVYRYELLVFSSRNSNLINDITEIIKQKRLDHETVALINQALNASKFKEIENSLFDIQNMMLEIRDNCILNGDYQFLYWNSINVRYSFIVDWYQWIELFCFDYVGDMIDKKYKNALNEKEKNEVDKGDPIAWGKICKALKRFVMRNLVMNNSIESDFWIMDYWYRIDLWDVLENEDNINAMWRKVPQEIKIGKIIELIDYLLLC